MPMPVVLRAKCVVVGKSSKHTCYLEHATYIAGDATVGKSALVQNYVSDGTKFPKTYFMVTISLPGD